MSHKLKTALLTAGLTSVLAILSSPAWAERGDAGHSMSDHSAQMENRDGHQHDDQRMDDRKSKRMEKKWAAMESELELTADQKTAWDSLKSAMQPSDKRHSKSREEHKAAFKNMTTPQRLDWMQTMFEQRTAEMKQRNQAIKAFYATLNDTQQKKFDEQFFRFSDRGWGGHDKKGHHE